MHKTLFTFAILIFIANIAIARSLTLSGKIKHPIDDNIDFVLLKDELTKDQLIYKATVQPDGNYAIALDLGEQQWITFRYAGQELDLFIAADATAVVCSFSSQDILGTIAFTGDDSASNSFFQSFRRTYQWDNTTLYKYEEGGLTTLIEAEIARIAKVYSEYDYFKKIQDDYNHQKQYLHQQGTLNRHFFQALNKEIDWRYEVNKMAYFLINKERLSVDELKRAWVKYAVLQNADISDDRAIVYPAYQNLLSAFVHYLDVEMPGNPSFKDFAFYRFIEKNLTGRSRYYMLARLMIDNYRNLNSSRLTERRLRAYRRENPYGEYTKALEGIFGGDLQYIPKIEVPDFKMMDLDRKELMLSSMRGRVIYISFWASWCAPCLKGFRETLQTRQHLEQQGVVFLNINLDDGETRWREAVQKNGVSGLNVFPVDMTTFQKEMKVSALPHYVLINKAGKLTYLSSDNINMAVADFQQLLME